MSKSSDMHVVHHQDGWALTKPGSDRPICVFNTQDEAVKAGHQAVHEAGGGELLVHGRDGRIRDKVTVSPGNDPFPPRG